MQLCGSLNILWHCLSLEFEWKLTFPVLWLLLSFPNLLAYWMQHFHSIIFQDLKQLNWNSITPLALFVVMLSKAHLTSHSRMSGSRWVITPLCLSWSWRSFLYSSVYSCHLLISYASVFSMPLLSFIEPIFTGNVPLTSPIFLKRSLFFLILLLSSISLHCSLMKAFLSLLAILCTSAQFYIFPFLLCQG